MDKGVRDPENDRARLPFESKRGRALRIRRFSKARSDPQGRLYRECVWVWAALLSSPSPSSLTSPTSVCDSSL
ncbi:hypothetical protein J5N97_012905 [Dioscorea zingiberensis]|uniref:Uncharacterized protein n=1 Tax=Dioscorea zingiberensis TaxID=325984 RepID=A0A9D5HI56_9LILI|nr:hypothetical protein J5N97_012905 [Dioscorea zingiberensis]